MAAAMGIVAMLELELQYPHLFLFSLKKIPSGFRDYFELQLGFINHISGLYNTHHKTESSCGVYFAISRDFKFLHIAALFFTYLIRGPPFLLSSKFSEKGGKRMGKQRYIWLDGEKTFVSDEVYYSYFRPVWREAKQRKVRVKMECSLDALKEMGFESISDEALVDEIVLDKLLLSKLFAVLSELTDDERSLIQALYLRNKTERELASETSVAQQTIHKKKNRILAKIRRLMDL